MTAADRNCDILSKLLLISHFQSRHSWTLGLCFHPCTRPTLQRKPPRSLLEAVLRLDEHTPVTAYPGSTSYVNKAHPSSYLLVATASMPYQAVSAYRNRAPSHKAIPSTVPGYTVAGSFCDPCRRLMAQLGASGERPAPPHKLLSREGCRLCVLFAKS